MTEARTPLIVALGRTPRTEALFTGVVSDPALRLELPAIPMITHAFPAMVREGRWPVSEMAIATFLMAKEAGRPLVLLPCVLAARAQEGSLLCREDSPLRDPHQLCRARIGVRSYSQTTGMWLRGVLSESHGVPTDEVCWTTFEEAHLAGFSDPPWCERAPLGVTLEGMLREDALDAAIFGSDAPTGFRTVFPNPAAASEAFRAHYGFVPVNHLLVARSDVARDGVAALAESITRQWRQCDDACGADARPQPRSALVRRAGADASRALTLRDLGRRPP